MSHDLAKHNRKVTEGLPVPLAFLPETQATRSGDDEAHNVPMITASPAELRDSELRYRRLFEAAQDGILILDAKTGRINDVNPFLIKLLGYSHTEFLKRFLWDVGLFNDADASKVAFEELKAKRYIRYENLPLKTKAGQQINVAFVSNVYREGGKDIVQCNIRDITERATAEQAEQRHLQSQKMEAIGQLAGGLAHDFNNLLGVILGYCEVLDERPELSASSRTMIHEIRHAGTSAKNLTQQLLAFSRRQLLQPVMLDLNESIRAMENMLGRLLGDNIELVSILAEDAGTIKADRNQFELMIMNLAINSRDAMPGGGRIVIETHNIDVDETYVEQHPSIGTGRHVLLTISDTGVGMDAETKSHLFEPFFSTKPPGQGTGLGLSTVFGIVAQSGGAVTVYSEPGRGTTFKVLFPGYGRTPAILAPVIATALPTGTETILLVDDATSLRLLTRKLLEHSGYTVIDSGDPTEALRIAAQHKGPLHLIIIDVVMPVLSGPVLAQKMSVIRPETKVLYTSGYTDSSLVRLHVPSRAYAFLGKPFTRAELIGKVREILDSGARLTQLRRASPRKWSCTQALSF